MVTVRSIGADMVKLKLGPIRNQFLFLTQNIGLAAPAMKNQVYKKASRNVKPSLFFNALAVFSSGFLCALAGAGSPPISFSVNRLISGKRMISASA